MAENKWVTGVISPYFIWVITPFTTGWGLPFGDHWEPVLFLFPFLFLSLAQDVPVHAHVPGAWIQKDSKQIRNSKITPQLHEAS